MDHFPTPTLLAAKQMVTPATGDAIQEPEQHFEAAVHTVPSATQAAAGGIKEAVAGVAGLGAAVAAQAAPPVAVVVQVLPAQQAAEPPGVHWAFIGIQLVSPPAPAGGAVVEMRA